MKITTKMFSPKTKVQVKTQYLSHERSCQEIVWKNIFPLWMKTGVIWLRPIIHDSAIYDRSWTFSGRDARILCPHWKIENRFKEINYEASALDSPSHNQLSTALHLRLCLLATTFVWMSCSKLDHASDWPHPPKYSPSFAFANLRRLLRLNSQWIWIFQSVASNCSSQSLNIFPPRVLPSFIIFCLFNRGYNTPLFAAGIACLNANFLFISW